MSYDIILIQYSMFAANKIYYIITSCTLYINPPVMAEVAARCQPVPSWYSVFLSGALNFLVHYTRLSAARAYLKICDLSGLPSVERVAVYEHAVSAAGSAVRGVLKEQTARRCSDAVPPSHHRTHARTCT